MIFELQNYNCDYPSKKGVGGVEDSCNMIGCYYNKVCLLVCLLNRKLRLLCSFYKMNITLLLTKSWYFLTLCTDVLMYF